MKKILQLLCIVLLCLCLGFITKARLEQALLIVPDGVESGDEDEDSLISIFLPETTTEPTPEPTVEPDPEYYVLSCIGDMTLTTNQNFSKTSSAHYASKMNGDYSYPFANTVQYFENDEITLGNLECSFSDRSLSNSIKALFYFLCPTEWINILPQGGVDFVTIANNHTMDFYEAGLTDTKAALDSINMAYGEDGQAQIITTKSGIKMGIYTSGNYDSVGTTVVPDKAAALAAIEQLKADGAEYIVVMFHWGSELKYRPTDLQVDLARACIDAGANLVYGSHSHCLQPIEEYNDGIILYSMGNWSFGGSTKPTDPYTAIFQLTLRRDPDGSIHNDSYEVIPCCVSSDLEGAAKDRDNYNDYKPTPLDPVENQEAYDRVLSILDGTYEGADQVRDYSDIYASYS
jgi:poly-gamma-glutamate synthesis protein (capsule biosynthesis protein)